MGFAVPIKNGDFYGGLIRTAPNLVLKTSGTRDGMGIDTSARRQKKFQNLLTNRKNMI